MNEKELMDKLKKSSEEIEVPDSLKPENIRKKLEAESASAGGQKQGDKTSMKKTLIHLAEAAAVFAVVAAASQGIGQMKSPKNEPAASKTMMMQEKETEDETATDEATANEITTDEATANEITTDAAAIEAAADEIAEETMSETAGETPGFTMPEDEEELYRKLQEYREAGNDYYDGYGLVYEMEENGGLAKTMEAAADNGSSDSGQSVPGYSETNLREAGVDEGDVVKTDGKYLYIMKSSSVVIVNVQEPEMKIESVIRPEKLNEYIQEIYLSGDTLCLVTDGYESTMEENGEDVYRIDYLDYCSVRTYDISDRTDPKYLGCVTQEGYYYTSRKNGDYVYLLTEFMPLVRDTWRNSEIMPLVGDSKIDLQNIYLPDAGEDTGYLVVSSVNINEPDQILDSKAIVSGINHVYVSKENLYICNNQWTNDENHMQILKISYLDGDIKAEGVGTVPGYINDSFSLDEYQGYLRVLTTESHYGNVNNLFILNDQMEVVSRIDDIAKGETIRSARFMGDIGYFVTFRQTDPLFSADLSDPEHPVLLGELKVSGFSSYLHPYGDGKLLGVGYEADEDTGTQEGVKLSMFDISDPEQVTEVCKYVMEDCFYLPSEYNYKAITVDADKNLIGFVCDSNYLVFKYEEGKGFENLLTYRLGKGETWTSQDDTRGVYVGDTFYINTDQEVFSFDMTDDFAQLDRIQLTR